MSRPTPSENAALDSAARDYFAAQAAADTAKATLIDRLAPYQNNADIPAGDFELVTGSPIVLRVRDDGSAGVDILPLLGGEGGGA